MAVPASLLPAQNVSVIFDAFDRAHRNRLDLNEGNLSSIDYRTIPRNRILPYLYCFGDVGTLYTTILGEDYERGLVRYARTFQTLKGRYASLNAMNDVLNFNYVLSYRTESDGRRSGVNVRLLNQSTVAYNAAQEEKIKEAYRFLLPFHLEVLSVEIVNASSLDMSFNAVGRFRQVRRV